MRKSFSFFLLGAAIAVLLVIIGCQGSTPTPSSKGPGLGQTREPVTVDASGREAFQKLYATAHLWAPDARPFRLQSDLFKTYTGQDGKAVIWRSGFASAARRSIKAFLWSGTHSEDGPSFGISSGTEDTYNPSNSSTQVFDPAFLKIDTNKAFEVAQQHGGAKLTKADAKQPVIYLLEWSPQENTLLWHVVYGVNVPDAKLKVAVNASTGAFVRVEK